MAESLMEVLAHQKIGAFPESNTLKYIPFHLHVHVTYCGPLTRQGELPTIPWRRLKGMAVGGESMIPGSRLVPLSQSPLNTSPPAIAPPHCRGVLLRLQGNLY